MAGIYVLGKPPFGSVRVSACGYQDYANRAFIRPRFLFSAPVQRPWLNSFNTTIRCF